MTTIAEIRETTESKMDQSIAAFKNNLTKIRTGRANPALLDTVGSGTTLIAAENLTRQCRACEISAPYIAVALQRYKDIFGIEAELTTARA